MEVNAYILQSGMNMPRKPILLILARCHSVILQRIALSDSYLEILMFCVLVFPVSPSQLQGCRRKEVLDVRRDLKTKRRVRSFLRSLIYWTDIAPALFILKKKKTYFRMIREKPSKSLKR